MGGNVALLFFFVSDLVSLFLYSSICRYNGQYIDAEAGMGNEVVLGTTIFEALKFNIGDTAPKDGLSGCYDALHIKLTDEEATRVYDFE